MEEGRGVERQRPTVPAISLQLAGFQDRLPAIGPYLPISYLLNIWRKWRDWNRPALRSRSDIVTVRISNPLSCHSATFPSFGALGRNRTYTALATRLQRAGLTTCPTNA